jgi:type II secretory pathway predicted ATPase ExeA
MYESFYGLRENPFSLTPDPDYLYLTRQHRMALTLLEYGLRQHAGFVLISGEVGSGKTTLIRQMLRGMNADVTVGLISNTHHAFGRLMHWVLLAFGLDSRGKEPAELYHAFSEFLIQEYGRGRRVLLIVDEAQNLDVHTLEELRLLSNINADKDFLLQMVLVGQPELRVTLQRAALRQFAQRISVDYHLKALDREETCSYVRHRLQVAGGNPDTIDREAIDCVHEGSGGVPRLVNSLCDMALVYGYAEQQQIVGAELMAQVIRDRTAGGIFPAPAADGVRIAELQ